MLERASAGRVPAKHHTALRGAGGELHYEECLSRRGFDGPYTLLYHVHRPHEARVTSEAEGWSPAVGAGPQPLARRHYEAFDLAASGLPPLNARVPLLFNPDLVVSVSRSSGEDAVYFSNADADELVFVHRGGGELRSPFGDLAFEAHDYVVVPKGIVHRFVPDAGEQLWLRVECLSGLALPSQFRNSAGQLRMDAPVSHRDFRRPEFVGPRDEGIRRIVVKRGGRFHAFEAPHSPFDVVGWDGAVYPWALPIGRFQPRVGAVHLPPTVHATFALGGALVCSFVPRPLDFHRDAIPCPYPHSSVDVDEVLYYITGEFTSRRGIAEGSVSHHPAGVPHGPHPGAYESSIGARATEELAVMLDCYQPLTPTPQALAIEDTAYHDSFAS